MCRVSWAHIHTRRYVQVLVTALRSRELFKWIGIAPVKWCAWHCIMCQFMVQVFWFRVFAANEGTRVLGGPGAGLRL
jgi:hypothetical protein